MNHHQQDAREGKVGRYWYEVLPWIFLLVTLPITFLVWQSERAIEYREKEIEFQARLDEKARQFTDTVKAYERAMYGLRIFFDASDEVSKKEFKLVVDEMLSTLPITALNQVGFIKLVDPLRPESYQHLNPAIQQKIKQLDSSALFAPVTLLEVKKGRQNLAIGEDAFTNTLLRKNMAHTALHNRVLLSDAIGVQQTNGLMSSTLPVYDHVVSRMAHQHKLEETDGWLFFNIDFSAIYSTVFQDHEQADIRFSLFSPSQQQPATMQQPASAGTPNLLFSSADNSQHHSIFSHGVDIDLLGKKWYLNADSLPAFEGKLDFSHSSKIGLLGIFIIAAITSILFLIVARLRTFDQLKAVNRRLKQSDERWRFALEGSGDGVWDWDIKSDRIEYSKRWKEIFGFEGVDLAGTSSEWENLLHPDDRLIVLDTMHAYLRDEIAHYSLEYRLKCKDGSWKWILSRGMVVSRDSDGMPTRMVGTHTDISQLKQSEEQIWQHANYDYLTNLPNRRMLYNMLEREITNTKNNGTKLALLFLDLDGFKEINDTLGHDQGDLLLKQASVRLTECTFKHDFVARLGGDEFIVLISNIALEKLHVVEKVAQKVLDTLAEPFELQNEKAFVAASVGIAIYPDDSSTIDGLIKNVDQAMYASKTRGGNCFTYFTPLMQERSLNRLRLSNDLRMALEKQQLFLVYQPVVNLRTNEIYKAEALLRWQHPERGLISPAEFIPIAEDTRLINEIGYWVLMASIQLCETWRQTLDKRFQIAVNKSAVQFVNPDSKHATWTEHLPTVSGEHNLIVVEITESLLLDASAAVTEKLHEYRSQGIQIALDDFGTGYSSLSYLKKFGIDYLKIDQSFIANLESSTEDRVLCKAIIEMAHSLGIQVIAEGIETMTQRDILVDAGCDYGQGYYFAKPLLPEAFEHYMSSKNTVEI